MKIEKLTDNKIRVILKGKDFKNKDMNIQSLLLSAGESNGLFLEILNRAKKEVDFNTDDHKLLVEAFFENDDTYIFTITKYLDSTSKLVNTSKKYVTAKKKNYTLNSKLGVYQFKSFDDFCSFCEFIDNTINFKRSFKSSILYFYNNSYYLVIDGFSLSSKTINYLHTSLLEFSKFLTNDISFQLKLLEHGKVIIKNNAISTGIKYFANK